MCYWYCYVVVIGIVSVSGIVIVRVIVCGMVLGCLICIYSFIGIVS